MVQIEKFAIVNFKSGPVQIEKTEKEKIESGPVQIEKTKKEKIESGPVQITDLDLTFYTRFLEQKEQSPHASCHTPW